MKHDLTKIVEKLKKITKFNVLNSTEEYLVIGTNIILKEAVSVGHDNKYCFQPYSAVRSKVIPTYFYIMSKKNVNKLKGLVKTPIFWVEHCKLSSLEQDLDIFLKEELDICNY